MSNVDHPSHYNKGIEVIEFIEKFNLDFSLGNFLKYFCRYPFKGKPKEDLEKALWYLKRYNVSKEDNKGLKEAIGNVLRDVALPLGIGIGAVINK